jgi:hypothetical protein
MESANKALQRKNCFTTFSMMSPPHLSRDLLVEPAPAKAIPALLLWPAALYRFPWPVSPQQCRRNRRQTRAKRAQGHNRYFIDRWRNVKSMTPIKPRFFQLHVNYTE